jgi:hypothetical protein
LLYHQSNDEAGNLFLHLGVKFSVPGSLRKPTSGSSMLMPKTALHENHLPLCRNANLRTAEQVVGANQSVKTHTAKHSSNHDFW